MFRKKNTYILDMESADATLQNIFAACEQPPNTIPFDKLILKESAKTYIYDRILLIIAICLALTLAMPILFYCLKEDVPTRSYITFSSHYIENDKLYLDLAIDNDTIRYEEAYLVVASGDIYEIISYDKKEQILCFPYLSQECNIYVPYDENSILHLVLSPDSFKEEDY